jgi:hypothetical protein
VAFAVIRRVRSRQSLVTGDRGHPYDRLVQRGWPVSAASGTYIATSALVASGVLVAVHLASMTAAVTIDVATTLLLVAGAAATGSLTPDEEART